MKNTSRALIIAGSIMVAIMIIAIGVYIYNNASTSIGNTMNTLDITKVEAFNNNFEPHRGEQTGYQVSMLVGKLMSNFTINKDESELLPIVSPLSSTYDNHDDILYRGNDQYMKALTKIKNNTVNNCKYLVKFEYDAKTGLINKVIIDDKD